MSGAAAPAAPARKGGLFNPVTAAAILVVGLVTFVLIMAGSAFDTGPREDLDGGTHALSKSAVGYAGAVALLKEMGRPVVVARGPVASEPGHRSLLIVTLDRGYAGSIVDEPVIERFAGPVLVVLPKWSTTMGERIGWVRKRGVGRNQAGRWLRPRAEKSGEAAANPGGIQYLRQDPGLFTHQLEPANPETPPSAVRTGGVDRWQTFSDVEGWRPLLVDESGRAVVMEALDDGDPSGIYVLSEPDLINTHGLADLQNARALLYVLDQTAGDSSVVFDVSLHGFERSRSFLREAFEPPFLAATLCAILTFCLMIWHAFFRFGRAREQGREFALGKRALADNQAELIKMAGRERLMGDRYGTLIRDLAARAVGAPKDMTPAELDAFLDRLGEGGRTSWPLSALRSDIQTPKDTAELVKAAERLHHWRVEMTREGGA